MTIPTHSSLTERVKRLDEATQWLLRMQDPKRTDAEINDWLRWCDANPENFVEFERLQRDWMDLDALKGGPPAVQVAPASHLPERYSGRRWISRPRTWAFAVAVAALVVVAAVALNGAGGLGKGETGSHPLAATSISRAATLPDGSKMILGAESRVVMDFNGPKRRLDLANGEAYFKVRHDSSRPFVVHAGELRVTAVGTAFDVRREQDRVTVTVEEGTVEVSSGAGVGRAATWRTEAGYQLTYSTRDGTASLASINSEGELAWRKGELAYVREPLGSVVEDLNRYSAHKIVIADPEIARLSFTGTAFASSVEDWLAGIEQAYPIVAQHTATGDIILHAVKATSH